MAGFNKSDPGKLLNSSAVTSLVGVINLLLPPVSPRLRRVTVVSSAGASICPTPPSLSLGLSLFLLLSTPPSASHPPPPRHPLPNARVTVAVTSVGRGPPRNMLRPFDMFVRGFGDERYHVLREEHLAGGKGYSIRIPPEPEPCAEFLPSDKSRQQVTVKREGRGVW